MKTLTVAELIEELSIMPPLYPVYFLNAEGRNFFCKEVILDTEEGSVDITD